MPRRELLLFLLLCIAVVPPGYSYTYSADVATLNSLKKQWKNVPINWKNSDPCGDGWVGIVCNNSRVTELVLFNVNIEGTLSEKIGNLTQLQRLDLSSNGKLGGTLPATLGNLIHLTSLRLVNCSFSGAIPDEIGNLANLTYLALNVNKFTGRFPPSLGKLSELTWLDLADNQLSGPLPISTKHGSGLDQLLKAEHFHLNQNNFTGEIPDIFSANMRLKHLLVDRNQLVGPIPNSIGLVRALKVIRLDNNHLTGPVPSISNLTKLDFLDLSNNQFERSEAPAWLSKLQNLRTLAIESGQLYGQIPQELFSFTHLQELNLRSNSLNGTMDMGNNVTNSLDTVNLEHNYITSVTLSTSYNNTLKLMGNPVCNKTHLSNTVYCLDVLQNPTIKSLILSNCSNPFKGFLVFRAPFFSDASDDHIAVLKDSLTSKLKTCTPNNLYIQNYFFDDNTYFWVQINICPVGQSYFNQSVVINCFDLNTQDYSPPEQYGPYYSTASPYHISSRERRYIIGIAIGCALLAVLLVLLGFCLVQKMKQAQREKLRNDPFASWNSGEESGEAPKLSGAKAFAYDELKMYTNSFKEINIIGSGGYGKVYRGMLPDKQLVAIKRSKEGSMQGGLEFKTEIELLSRVHHKNLVGLVGFCFEKGERMLVYEYICNGTLRDSLSGASGIQLNWSKRLKIAVDSATGLAYLHNHANPPIIHRDVKSTNILLDENLTAKVSDFGLSLFVSNSEIGHITTHVKGTLGYLDPEYYTTKQLTGKSDVYSFGVVLLELLTAQPPIFKDQKYIVREVRAAFNKQDKQYLGLKDLIDPILINKNENLVGLDRFMDLALQCVEEEASMRPMMTDIVKEIEDIMQYAGFKINSGLSIWDKNNPVQRYSMDVSSSSGSQGNINSSDFKYSGGFPSSWKLNSS
ncbi:leucine-rich repeat receptor protein kinase HPCA1-like isoform X2 [Carex rostrata]